MLVSYTLDKTKRLQPLYIRDLTIKIPSILGTSNWTPYFGSVSPQRIARIIRIWGASAALAIRIVLHPSIVAPTTKNP